MIKPVFIFLVLCFTCNSMYISFGGKPTCFTIEDEPGKEVKFFYEVIGSDGTGHKT